MQRFRLRSSLLGTFTSLALALSVVGCGGEPPKPADDASADPANAGGGISSGGRRGGPAKKPTIKTDMEGGSGIPALKQ
ncbi:MAG: hypothetical protein U0835_24640 [Isosphaeraceae bacterium]